MSFNKALPIVDDCCIVVRDLKQAASFAAAYCLICNFIYDIVTFISYGCKSANPTWMILLRLVSDLVLLLGIVPVVVGIKFNHNCLLYVFITLAHISFMLDVVYGFLYLYYVTKNMEYCREYSIFVAGVRLMLPMFLYYAIIIVNSFRDEVSFILRKPEDIEDPQLLYYPPGIKP